MTAEPEAHPRSAEERVRGGHAGKIAARAIRDAIPLPLSLSILRHAAFAPPWLKTEFFERVCTALATPHFSRRELNLHTNFGISSALDCEIPIRKPAYLFGKPENALAECSTLALVRALLPDCDHFVDVGANEGIFTLVAAVHGPASLKLHWFEPDHDLHSRMEANLKRNGISALGHRLAVSDTDGSASFYRNLSDDASGSLAKHFCLLHDVRPETVGTVTLSSYFAANAVQRALVKIDVEGHALSVWAGAADVANSMSCLVIEMLEPEIRAGLPSRIIHDTGWNAYYIRNFDLVHSPDGDFTYVGPFVNWLFCSTVPDLLGPKLAGHGFRVISA